MLRWNPTRTAWKAPALALALLAGPAAVPALAGPAPGQVVPPPTLRSVLLDWSFDPLVAVPLLAVAAHGALPERPRHDRPGAPVADRALRHRAVLGARKPPPDASDVGGAAAGDGRPHHHAADDHVATGA